MKSDQARLDQLEYLVNLALARLAGSVSPSSEIALFGDGSGGDVVISAPNTPVSAILNANSIHITGAGSILVPLESQCFLRAKTFIRIDGPINGNARISSAQIQDSPAIVQYVGSTGSGGSGGGGGGGSGASGAGANGNTGNDIDNKTNSVGFSRGNGSTGGSSGPGGAPGNPGGNGGNATLPTSGVDITEIGVHIALYPAGPGAYFDGAVPGLQGAAGVGGGAGSGGAVGGVGGSPSPTEGLGGSNILLVSPSITVNALVSANGGNGSSAPSFGDPGGPTQGASAPVASNEGGGGGGSGGGGAGGGAGGLVLAFYSTLVETVPMQANPGLGGHGGLGAPGGAGDGAGFAGGNGGNGADGATGSNGTIVRQKIA